MTEYRLELLGGGGVGKSALTFRFVQNVFVENYDPTIEDWYRKQVTIDKQTYLLELLDTAGQEKYLAMREGYTKTGQGFLLIYSITSRTSFEEITSFHEQTLRVKDVDKVPIVLIGNKCDLENAREVTTAEGRDLAKSLGCPFFETSAKQSMNVEDAFFQLTREVRMYLHDPQPHSSKKKKPCILL